MLSRNPYFVTDCFRFDSDRTTQSTLSDWIWNLFPGLISPHQSDIIVYDQSFFRTGAQTNAVSTDDAVYFMGLNSPWEPAKEIHKFQNNQWTLNVGRLLSDQYHRTSIQIGNEFLIYGNSWITELWNPETDTSSNMSGNAFGLGLYRPQLFGVRSDFCQPSNWFRYSITKSLQFHYIIFGLVS